MTLFGYKYIVDMGCILKGSDFCKWLLLWCLSPQHRGNNINPYWLLHGDGVLSVGSSELIPHIIFDYVITTHQFNSTPYFTKQLSDSRIKIQNKVRELHNQGIGYTKIHRYLMENGFEIGKSRTTVDSMIKNMKKRDEFFSQPIIDGIGNFRIKMMEV